MISWPNKITGPNANWPRQLPVRTRRVGRVVHFWRSAASLVMDSAHVKTVLASLVIVVALNCDAQIYSIHVYSGGRVYDHQWLIGSPPNYYGFTQYREYQDAQGRVLVTSQQHQTVRMPTYTHVHLGRFGFRVRMPAAGVATIAAVFLVLLGCLPIVVRGRVRTGRR